jgi:PAS domain S-box-containing protein
MLNEEMARQAQESREAQAVIERGKRQWEATFDSVADLILLTDDNGQIVRCNRATTQTFQSDFNQILGMHIDELFFGSSGSEKTQFPAERADAVPAWKAECEVVSSLERKAGCQARSTWFAHHRPKAGYPLP